MKQTNQDFFVARVVAHHRGKYRVNEFWAEITGKTPQRPPVRQNGSQG